MKHPILICFDHNPNDNDFYFTSDGLAWRNGGQADVHASRLEDTRIAHVTRAQIQDPAILKILDDAMAAETAPAIADLLEEEQKDNTDPPPPHLQLRKKRL